VVEDVRIQRTRKDVTAAALEILLKSGWAAVTHSAVAKASGYSRATLYTHWPSQLDLVRDAFSNYQQMPHFQATGDLKKDLTGELKSFVNAMTEFHLDRALAMLSEKSQVDEAITPIRDSFVAAGESPIRESLANEFDAKKTEAVTLMLCGMVTHSVLMHGMPPSSQIIEEAVSLVLAGIEVRS
jgi:AcrR family transcriptional regulator